MGSLCCVAARPNGASTASREWSAIGRSDPFWRTNTSFSPPLSRRQDYRFHSEGLSYGSLADSGAAVNYGSSLSSSSKDGSWSWERSELPVDYQYSSSEGGISDFSSPVASSENHHFLPPLVHGVNIGEFMKVPAPEPIDVSLFLEGTSGLQNNRGSISSRSDGGDYELMPKFSSAPRNLSSRRPFVSKPIHPLSFVEHTIGGEGAHISLTSTSSSNPLQFEFKPFKALGELCSSGVVDSDGGIGVGSTKLSSASSCDLSELPDAESSLPLCSDTKENSKCGLCERLLSKRSPYGSRRIVRTGDMPVASILPCCHVYHAECLERTIPKNQKHDPPCPICDKLAGKDTEKWAICRLKNGQPRLRSLGEGPSRVWSCAQPDNFVGGAMNLPKSSSMLVLCSNGFKSHPH